MKKLIALLLSAALSMGNIAPYPRPSVVPLQIVVDEKLGGCTGFYVQPRVIITAAHCIGDVVKADGETLVLIKRSADLAVYHTSKNVRWPFSISRAKVGDIVTAVGNAYSRGNVALIRRVAKVEDDGVIWMDGPIAPGMSGGPVINEKGDVVGLIQARNEVFGLACGSDELKDFLGQ